MIYQAVYSVNKNIKLKNPKLRSDFCDYKDEYIFVKGTTDLGTVRNSAMTLKRFFI